jgi:hypothetical protein
MPLSLGRTQCVQVLHSTAALVSGVGNFATSLLPNTKVGLFASTDDGCVVVVHCTLLVAQTPSHLDRVISPVSSDLTAGHGENRVVVVVVGADFMVLSTKWCTCTQRGSVS